MRKLKPTRPFLDRPRTFGVSEWIAIVVLLLLVVLAVRNVAPLLGLP